MQALQGKKSYMSGAAVIVIGGAHFLGWLTEEQAMSLVTMVGGGAFMAHRSAMKKLEK